MVKILKEVKRESKRFKQTKGFDLLHALNTAAALFQQATHSKDAVFKAVKEELDNFGLRGGVNLLNESRDYLTVCTVGGMSKIISKLQKLTGLKVEGYKFKVDKIDVYKQVITTGKVIFIEDVSTVIIQHLSGVLKKFTKPVLKAFGKNSGIFAPLIIEKQVFGVLNIMGDGISRNDLPAFQAFAHHIAIALNNANLFSTMKKAETRYRRCIESSNDAIFVVDPSTNQILSVNPKAVEITGYSKTELLKMSILNLHPSNSVKEAKRLYKKIQTKGHSLFELPLKQKNGRELIVQVSANIYKVNEQQMMQVLCRDITEQKQIEEALKESEAKFRIISEQSLFAIVIMQDGLIKYVNKMVEESIEYSVEEIYKWSTEEFAKVIHPDDLPFVMEQAQKKQRGDPDVIPRHSFRMITKSGKIIWIDQYSKTIYLKGKPANLVTLIDITEQKNAENALAAEKNQLDVTLRSIGDGVITTDIKGNVVLINKAGETLTGWTQEKAIGKPLKKILQTNRIAESANQTVLISKDGTERIIATNGAPIHDKENNIIGAVLIFRDITEKQKMEKELLKIQKLESLGILAGGIAHDFNNILTTILGNIDLAMEKINEKDDLYDLLNNAENALMRAQNFTNQLLTFARGGSPIKTTTSIIEIIKESAAFSLSGSNVKCNFNFPENPWQVEVDTGQISQVFNNLIINADQAMPKGGIIEVITGNIIIKNKSRLPLDQGPYVKITIRDQGIGIPEKYISKIFDPYFTTKKKGNGLGLTICYSIIEKHKGYITVESKVRKGTAIDVYLPASAKKHVKKTDIDYLPITGTGKILIMDDDVDVLNTVDSILQHSGYNPFLTKDSKEAIEIFKKAKETGTPFDVVILDLTIPGEFGGRETLKKLHEIDKNVKAIVSSGYSNDPIMSNYKKYGFNGVIVKPYKINKLNRVLNKVIDTKYSFIIICHIFIATEFFYAFFKKINIIWIQIICI